MDALDNFYTDQSFVSPYKTTHNIGHSWHFSKKDQRKLSFTRWRCALCVDCSYQSLDLMIINFENTASHKHLVQTSKSLGMTRSEMTEHFFLF